jgi:hypothetical protein
MHMNLRLRLQRELELERKQAAERRLRSGRRVVVPFSLLSGSEVLKMQQ